MPRLSCWSCGRQIYTVAPLEALFAEERRCPRCGAFLREERRETERRTHHRRTNPTHDPGPPRPTPAPDASDAPDASAAAGKGRKRKGADKAEPTAIETDAAANERRLAERRLHRRRGSRPSA